MSYEDLFHELKDEVEGLVRQVSQNCDCTIDFIPDNLNPFKSGMKSQKSALANMMRLSHFNQDIVNIVALIHSIDEHPLISVRMGELSNKQTSQETTKFANAVFALYISFHRLNLDLADLPRQTLLPLAMFFFGDSFKRMPGQTRGETSARSDLTAGWLMFEALMRPRWFDDGYHWTQTALNPRYTGGI